LNVKTQYDIKSFLMRTSGKPNCYSWRRQGEGNWWIIRRSKVPFDGL